MITKSVLLAIASISVASAQVQPNPPTGLSINESDPSPDPPPAGVMFADDFNYVVDRLGSGDEKQRTFAARGYSTVKDQTTRSGANGYLYTRTTAPGCGASPVGDRMLTMEALPTTFGAQTDFYLQLGNGQAGDIPARLYVQFYMCMSRSGAEMSNVLTTHNKLFYPLFGTRDGYPMAVEDQAWLQTMSDVQFRGSVSVPAPETGAFTFRTYAPGRAEIANQVSSGTPGMMTPNVGDPWVRPNRWYKIRMMFDVSSARGVHKIWMAPAGQPLALITDWTAGVTSGFAYETRSLDVLGAKYLRFPTTVGPGTGTPGPDYWLNLDQLRMARTEADLE